MAWQSARFGVAGAALPGQDSGRRRSHGTHAGGRPEVGAVDLSRLTRPMARSAALVETFGRQPSRLRGARVNTARRGRRGGRTRPPTCWRSVPMMGATTIFGRCRCDPGGGWSGDHVDPVGRVVSVTVGSFGEVGDRRSSRASPTRPRPPACPSGVAGLAPTGAAVDDDRRSPRRARRRARRAGLTGRERRRTRRPPGAATASTTRGTDAALHHTHDRTLDHSLRLLLRRVAESRPHDHSTVRHRHETGVGALEWPPARAEPVPRCAEVSGRPGRPLLVRARHGTGVNTGRILTLLPPG